MTYQTHKQYAISFSFLAVMIVYTYGISSINYYLALPIMILVGKYGGLFPDIDHTWQNVKEKTVPNWIINKIIHLTGGKHRSWQTHSIDIVVIFTAFCIVTPTMLYNQGKITIVNKEVATLLLTGFCSGWISHLLADMMTSAGVRLFFWNKKIIIRLVPRQLFGLRFNTGHEWEEFVYRLVKTVNIILGIICVLYPLALNGTMSNLINTITT